MILDCGFFCHPPGRGDPGGVASATANQGESTDLEQTEPKGDAGEQPEAQAPQAESAAATPKARKPRSRRKKA